MKKFNDTSFTFAKGGFQGARSYGSTGGNFYLENVFEEWDAPNEWWFDERTRCLYYYYNGTAEGPVPTIPADVKFEATNVKGLVSIVADMSAPAVNISIKGIGFKDTMYTYLDPHEMPSGGDWVSAIVATFSRINNNSPRPSQALQRSGAMFMVASLHACRDLCALIHVHSAGRDRRHSCRCLYLLSP